MPFILPNAFKVSIMTVSFSHRQLLPYNNHTCLFFLCACTLQAVPQHFKKVKLL